MHEAYKEEIFSTFSKISDRSKKVDWCSFVKSMQSTIVQSYKGDQSLVDFKRHWKHTYKYFAKEFGYTCKRNTDIEDSWQESIEDNITIERTESIQSSKSSSSRSTSSLKYQRKLGTNDVRNLSNIHKNIKNKWILKSGRSVEDILYNVSKSFTYEHPSHSYIVDLSDGTWEDHMEQEDFEEISSCYDNALNKPLPDYLKEILCKLDKKCCSSDIYDEFSTIAAHPVKDPEVFWLKQAVINFVLLFMDQNDATLKMPSTEQDLLEDIFGFIKKSKRLTGTTCVTGNESRASSEHRNSTRMIGSICQEERKTSGEHADLCFYYGSNELACLELGLADSGSHGTKELNEAGIKVPIMMKNFALQISRQYGINMSGIKIVGFMISGLNLTALLMTFEGSTSLITRSKRLRLPETVADIPRLLPLVLKLVFNAAQIVKGTMNTIKEASMSVCLDNDNDLPFFPPCYVSSSKRKTPEDD